MSKGKLLPYGPDGDQKVDSLSFEKYRFLLCLLEVFIEDNKLFSVLPPRILANYFTDFYHVLDSLLSKFINF